jgi:hypothetical protein
VRVLVQRKGTREYLRAPRQWTRHEPEAIDFEKTVRAVEHCIREKIQDAQLVLAFEEDRNLDIVLPLNITETPSGQRRQTHSPGD